jgi:prefoldin subunit 5
VVVVHSFRGSCTCLLVSAMLGVGAPAFAQTPAPAAATQDQAAALRAAIEQLRQQLDALQQKIAALEAAAAQ